MINSATGNFSVSLSLSYLVLDFKLFSRSNSFMLQQLMSKKSKKIKYCGLIKIIPELWIQRNKVTKKANIWYYLYLVKCAKQHVWLYWKSSWYVKLLFMKSEARQAVIIEIRFFFRKCLSRSNYNMISLCIMSQSSQGIHWNKSSHCMKLNASLILHNWWTASPVALMLID